MDGRTELRAKLIADSAVVALVGTYKGSPAVFDAPLAPNDYEDNAVTMYLSASFIGGPVVQAQNTVNCFAKTYTEAENIQAAVYDSLYRSRYDDVAFTPSKQVVIPPQNTGGDYNAPVEVLTKQAIGG